MPNVTFLAVALTDLGWGVNLIAGAGAAAAASGAAVLMRALASAKRMLLVGKPGFVIGASAGVRAGAGAGVSAKGVGALKGAGVKLAAPPRAGRGVNDDACAG